MFKIKEIKIGASGRKFSCIIIRKLNKDKEEYFIRGCDYRHYKRELIPVFIKEVNDKYNIDLRECRFSWNQNYGCICGCSPAFKINGLIGKEFDILIEEV